MFKKRNQNIVISEDTPFVSGKLTVYPNRLKYKDRKCNFNDIAGIHWYWLSQTINLVTTQKVTLGIYIRGVKKPIELNKTTLFVRPKIVEVYNFISSKTFQSRLKIYTDQLEEFGGFRYRGVIIYSDGRVVRNDKTFMLKNAIFEPFKISIKKGGIFSPKCVIEATLDSDVLFALIDYILKNPQDVESIRENARKRKEAEEAAGSFLPNLICMLAKIAKADGFVSKEEIEVISNFFLHDLELDKEEYKIAVEIFREAKTSPLPCEIYAQNILHELGNNNPLLTSIVDLLFTISLADGHFSAEEELIVAEIESLFDVVGKTKYSSYRHQQEATSASFHGSETQYYEILGLEGSTTPEEIKVTYKRLVMQYHPDRVQHLGPDFLNLAEEKMKEINIAYDFFRKKYDL